MRVKTREVLQTYEQKFGRSWDADLSKIKNSEEAALVAEIEEAMKNPPKKKRTRASLITGSIVDEKES